ncbi:TIGR03767 family metallophosphoesterase [Streptomyces luteolus]|uniref:TIGR03767 family metallophosphoesterase n=1 Tax=Streptomyces luteolus TaxID=3043615 RepID=A0ABT6T1U6_9ACTN|nr:TIGR03767 family metallophosphoesterase [Streptomyces sp. B-S-A12]MDI3421834.1 TIGR03767 family metallophosphoesterase [Streptomyces sp. B-S-A12]
MPRIRSVAASLDRRSFLAAAGAVSASTGIGLAVGLSGGEANAARPAAARPEAGTALTSRKAPAAPLTPYISGTTLHSTSAPRPAGQGYVRLGEGPGWERVVRTDLAAPESGRADRRTALAAFVQFTDLHIVDTQHPLRYEYVRAETSSAWRPQETLSVAGAVALVERVNALRGAPATGAPLSFVMTTGDNTDNNSRAELDWFLRTMSGGSVTPNTGDPRHYEGVQDSGLKQYWHPDRADFRDADKQLGFPAIPGFLEAATREVRSPGLNLPWYSTVGNHDSLPGGCYASGDAWFHEFAVGGKKLMSLPEDRAAAFWKSVKKGRDPKGEQFRELMRTERKRLRSITPDASRAPFTPTEYVRAHLDPAYAGPGPIGHGYTRENVDAGTQYYAFRIADDVLGISLDTTDPAGHYEGSLGTAQLDWLERELTRAEQDGSYVVVFSHHTSTSMRNLRPDPDRPREARHGGEEVLELLGRHSRVLAWINGHSHRNRITPHGSFWEITTASHIDHPQLARVVELVDNHDGTLSVLTTLIESSAPHRTDLADLSQPGLGALYRELAFNAPGRKPDLGGDRDDRNTELVLRKG